MKRILTIVALILSLMLLLCACDEPKDSDIESNIESDSESNIESELESDLESELESDIDSDEDSDVPGNTNPGAGGSVGGDGTEDEKPDNLPTVLFFNPSTVHLHLGQSAELKVLTLPTNAKKVELAWSIEDGSVASISQEGVVTASKNGKTTVTVYSENGLSATCQIEVICTPKDAVKENDMAPTCTEGGQYDMVVYCSECDVELSRETIFINKNEHNFSELKETKAEPSCTEAGTAVYECECGETTEKEIPAKGHTNETKTVEATCKDNGYTIDVCTVCKTESNKTITESASDKYHKFDKVIDEPADCNTNKKGRKGTVCSICDAENPKLPIIVIDPIHEWDDPIIVPATCTEPGSEMVKCKNCPFIKGIDPLDPLGHDWEADESTRVAANCYHGSQVTNVCGTCGATEAVEANDKREHDIEEGIIPATCDTAAIVYEECSYDDCDYYREIASQGQMLGHDIAGAKYITVPETCTTPGSRIPICNRCEVPVTYDPLLKESLVQILEPCAHYTVSSYAPAGTVGYEVTLTVKASCHNDKYEIWKCTSDPNCAEKREVVYEGTKLPHNYVKITDVYPDAQLSFAPTCVSVGYDLQICTNCIAGAGNEYQCEGDGETPCYKHVKTAEKADHDITTVEYFTFVDSTCLKPARVQYDCGNCLGCYSYEYPTEDTGAAQVGSFSFVPLKEHGEWAYANESVEATCTSYGYELYQCRVDEECTYMSKREQTRYAEHDFIMYENNRIACQVCEAEYIVAELYAINAEESYLATGFATNVEGGLIVLEAAADNVEYTITIIDNENNEKKYTIYATVDSGRYVYVIVPNEREEIEAEETIYIKDASEKIVFLDLYSEESVKSIKIESTEDVTIGIYAKSAS